MLLESSRAKAACRMLVNSIPGVNFINSLHPAFTCADPKSAKKDSQIVSLFVLLRSTCAKPVCKMLVKLTLGGWETVPKVLLF